MKQIAHYKPKGLVSDITAARVGADHWTTGLNFVVRPFAERVGGYAAVYTGANSSVRALQWIRIPAGDYWLYHGIQGVWAVTGGSPPVHTNLSPVLSAASSVNRMSVGAINQLPIRNDGVNAPMYWDQNLAHTYAALTGWPAATTCGALRAWKNFLFALDVTAAGARLGTKVMWSSAATAGAIPTSWTAAATNEAGDASLADTPGELIDAAPLGQGLAIYKQRCAYLAEYLQGSNYVFSFRKLPITRGVLGLNCIGEVRGRHFLLTEGDMVVTDGNTVESVADTRTRKLVFDQLDQTNYKSAFVAENKRESEIWVCYPTAGNTFCNRAAVWNWAQNEWGYRELPSVACAALGVVADTTPAENWNADSGTWNSDSSLWNTQAASSAVDSLVFGYSDDSVGTNSRFFKMDSGDTANGTDIAAIVGKYSMDLNDESRVKSVRRVYPQITAPTPGGTVYVRVGSQMTEQGSITWSAEQAYVIGTGKFISTFSVGRYHSIEFRSAGGGKWAVAGFGLEYEERGYH